MAEHVTTDFEARGSNLSRSDNNQRESSSVYRSVDSSFFNKLSRPMDSNHEYDDIEQENVSEPASPISPTSEGRRILKANREIRPVEKIHTKKHGIANEIPKIGETQLKSLFHNIDKDSDGLIAAEDVTGVLAELNPKCSSSPLAMSKLNKELLQVISLYSTNGDSYLNFQEFSEFMHDFSKL